MIIIELFILIMITKINYIILLHIWTKLILLFFINFTFNYKKLQKNIIFNDKSSIFIVIKITKISYKII